MRPRILIVDDEVIFIEELKKTLKKLGMSVATALNPQEALEKYREEKLNFDLILMDYHFSGQEITGSDLALKIKSLNQNQAIVFMTGHTDLSYYVSMLQSGVGKDFIQKDADPTEIIERILLVLKSVIKAAPPIDSEEEELRRASAIGEFGLAGRSQELYKCVKLVKSVRMFRSQFMIIGPSGAGKELLAQAFKVPGKPFISISCAKFNSGSEQFLESELFGHKKGAYTGAISDVVGAFESARGGVIYLDELHHLSLNAQAKLLRALQENKFRRMGDPSGPERIIESTIVTATQPDIFKMIEQKSFMPDLFYRLAKTKIVIPELAARKSDIQPLSLFFASKVSKMHNLHVDFEAGLLREFEAYHWPGNVRELYGFIEGAAMASNEALKGTITLGAFREYLASIEMENKTHSSSDDITPLEPILNSVEHDKIVGALRRSKSVSKAAELLSIARSTLVDRMQRLRIEPKKFLSLSINQSQPLTSK